MITESQVSDALRTVKWPGFSRDIVSFGVVKAITISGPDVSVRMEFATADPNVPRQINMEATAACMCSSAPKKWPAAK